MSSAMRSRGPARMPREPKKPVPVLELSRPIVYVSINLQSDCIYDGAPMGNILFERVSELLRG